MLERAKTRRKKANPYSGSTLESWLKEDGIYEEVTASAQKGVLAWQIEQLMAKQKITKTELAKRMKTSRAAVDRLLDPNNRSVTLLTLTRAASALG
ncbi:MAG: XRE family transcriptional regulator [Alphaproteobacteria bacterium]|nr:XRE family transcriptional regulator [Alphaproteobacteria bacterium]